MARKEGFENTWVNYFAVYVRDYGSKDSQTANELSSDEAGAIGNHVKWDTYPSLALCMLSVF